MTYSAQQTQVIDLAAGAAEYTWPMTLTELTGKNISTDTVKMAVGSQNVANSIQDWVTPDVVVESTITAKEFMIQNPNVPGVEVPAGTDPALFTLYQVTAQLMIGAVTVNHASISPDPGDYYPSIRAVDTSETVPRRGQKFTVR